MKRGIFWIGKKRFIKKKQKKARNKPRKIGLTHPQEKREKEQKKSLKCCQIVLNEKIKNLNSNFNN